MFQATGCLCLEVKWQHCLFYAQPQKLPLSTNTTTIESAKVGSALKLHILCHGFKACSCFDLLIYLDGVLIKALSFK